MKKVLLIIIVLVVAAGGFAVYTLTKDDTPTSTGDSSQMDNMPKSTSSTAQATDKVTIKDLAFGPTNITVKKGTTVTWTNQDSTAHTVTESDGQTGPDSDTLGNGQSYSFTFNTVGSFKYHCSIHSSMTGSVTVTQ